jgi:HEAT repeat protein
MNREEAMLQVLVSSTFSDLSYERDAVRAEIEELSRLHPIAWVGMEEFGSLASTPLEASTGHAAQADLIILIVGARVGSLPPDEEASFTRQEFETALANRVPCLAYFSPIAAGATDPAAVAFQDLVRREVTHSTFDSPADLARRVRSDLERELREIVRTDDLDLRIKGPAAPPVFVNRAPELARLRKLLASPRARFAIVAGPGFGKTTLMKQFLDSEAPWRHEPIWLTMDSLLGRDAGGRRLFGAPRLGYDTLRAAVARRVENKPRAFLIYDNAQADARATRLLAHQFSEVSSCCLTWDKASVPYGFELLELGSLGEAPSVELLEHYCSEAQAEDRNALKDLANQLDGYPLAIELAGLRLMYDTGKQVRELAAELAGSTDIMVLSGKTVDKSNIVIRQLLKDLYHMLDASERTVLASLAAVPSHDYSEETVQFFAAAQSLRDLRRSLELMVVKHRLHPDWRGHRYSIRDLVRDFLRTTDEFKTGEAVFKSYLLREEAFRDSSIVIVGGAIAARAGEGTLLNGSSADRVIELLVQAPYPMRAQIRDKLAGLLHGRHRELLAEKIAGILTDPQRTEISIELLDLLAALSPVTTKVRRAAERIWEKPLVAPPHSGGEGGLDPLVALAAGKVLAKTAGHDLTTWLAGEVRSDDPARVERALDAAGRAFLTELLPECHCALRSSNHEVRVIAAEAFGGFHAGYGENRDFRLDDATREDLCKLMRDDPYDDLRDAAAFSLASWGDERCLSHLQAKLRSHHWKERNSAVIAIRQFQVEVRYRQRRDFDFTDLLHVINTLAESDPDERVRVHSTVVLIEARDPRAAASIVRLLDEGGEYGRRMARGFVPTVGEFLDQATRSQVADALSPGLSEVDPYVKAWCRRGLLDLLDPRGMDGLWDHLAEMGSESDLRWHVLDGLRKWEASKISVTKLRRYLNDPDPQMRATAATVAGEAKVYAVTDDLATLAKDETPLRTQLGETGSDRTVGDRASQALDQLVAGVDAEAVSSPKN